MPWSDTGRDQRAAATAGLVTDISIHSADPGTDGTANEWDRVTANFSADGTGQQTASVSFTGDPSTAATHVGFWSGTDFLGAFGRTSGDAESNAAGEYGADIPLVANA